MNEVIFVLTLNAFCCVVNFPLQQIVALMKNALGLHLCHPVYFVFSQKENIRLKNLSAQVDSRTIKGAAVTHPAVFSNLVLLSTSVDSFLK